VTTRKLLGELAHARQLGRADGRKVGRMREEDRPTGNENKAIEVQFSRGPPVAHPVVELFNDALVRGRLEVGEHVAEEDGHAD